MGLLLGGGRTAQNIINLDRVKAQMLAQAEQVAKEANPTPKAPTQPPVSAQQRATMPVQENDPALTFNPNLGVPVEGYDPYYDAVEREWIEAAETVQNYFGTNDLWADELNSIKDKLGIDLKKISDRYVQAGRLHELSPLQRFEKLMAFGVADQYYPSELVDRYLRNNLPLRQQATAQQSARGSSAHPISPTARQSAIPTSAAITGKGTLGTPQVPTLATAGIQPSIPTRPGFLPGLPYATPIGAGSGQSALPPAAIQARPSIPTNPTTPMAKEQPQPVQPSIPPGPALYPAFPSRCPLALVMINPFCRPPPSRRGLRFPRIRP